MGHRGVVSRGPSPAGGPLPPTRELTLQGEVNQVNAIKGEQMLFLPEPSWAPQIVFSLLTVPSQTRHRSPER